MLFHPCYFVHRHPSPRTSLASRCLKSLFFSSPPPFSCEVLLPTVYVKTGRPRPLRPVLREPRRSGPQQIVATYDGVTAEPFKAGNLLDFLLQRTWTVLWLGVSGEVKGQDAHAKMGKRFFYSSTSSDGFASPIHLQLRLSHVKQTELDDDLFSVLQSKKGEKKAQPEKEIHVGNIGDINAESICCCSCSLWANYTTAADVIHYIAVSS